MGGKPHKESKKSTITNSEPESSTFNDLRQQFHSMIQKPKEISFKHKIILFSLGFQDPNSVLHRLPKDILLTIVTHFRVSWSEERCHNAIISEDMISKPTDKPGLDSFQWNSFGVTSEFNSSFYSIQLCTPMHSSEYQSACVMIGLAEESQITKGELNLYTSGGYYSMFWQFKCYQYGPPHKGFIIEHAKVSDDSVVTVEYIKEENRIVFWGSTKEEYESKDFRKNFNGEYKNVTFSTPYYLVVLLWRNGDSVKLLQ